MTAIAWSPKWTILKLTYRDGSPMGAPWHIIPPYTPIPPRNIPHSELVRLYKTPGGDCAVTYAGALQRLREKIRETV